MKFCKGLMSAGIGLLSIIVKYLKNNRYICPLPPKVEHLIAIEKWTVEDMWPSCAFPNKSASALFVYIFF